VSASLNCCSSTAALNARTTSSNGLPSRLRRWLTSRCTSDEDQRVGWCRQVDGTAGLHSAPEMPCAPRRLRLVPLPDSMALYREMEQHVSQSHLKHPSGGAAIMPSLAARRMALDKQK
jgi:hypothetical protein